MNKGFYKGKFPIKSKQVGTEWEWEAKIQTWLRWFLQKSAEERSCPRDQNLSWELGFAVPLGKGKFLSTSVLAAGRQGWNSALAVYRCSRAELAAIFPVPEHSRDHSPVEYWSHELWSAPNTQRGTPHSCHTQLGSKLRSLVVTATINLH